MIGKPLFTPEQAEYLRENVAGRGHVELANMVNVKFGLLVTREQIKSYLKNHGLSSGLTGRFGPGHEPANKGKKGIQLSPATEWKKGNRPHNSLPVGSEILRDDGYLWVKIAEPNKWRQKHVLIWEAANGPRPKDHAVIFGDGDRLNLEPDNLILITRAQLVRLNQNGLIGCSAELTRTGILVADIISKCAERKKSQKKKLNKKCCIKEATNRIMKTTLTISLIGWSVRGIDRRTGGTFEDFIVIDKPPVPYEKSFDLSSMQDRIKEFFAELGYAVQAMERENEREITLDLDVLYDKWGLPAPLSPAAEAVFDKAEEKENPEPTQDDPPTFPGPEPKETCEPNPPENVSQMTVKHDFEQVIASVDAGIKKRHRRTKEELAAAEKQEAKDFEKYNKPKPTPFDRPTEDIALGEIDEAKLRRKTHTALVNYCAQHSSEDLRPIIRATGNRVTEETIRAILADSDAGRLVYVQAIDKGLKKLALADAGRESDSRGYDMT